MKIEKVNENQIRCTLTRDDLVSRELKISELAYGTEKAKNLFRDMMRQANYEFGFEAEDIPLMIEAVPLNADCIVLIITKVEDPDELDTRFSRFAPSVTEEDMEEDDGYEDMNDTEVMDLFHRIQSDKQAVANAFQPGGNIPAPAADSGKRTRLFRIASIGLVMTVSQIIAPNYRGQSTLYKDASSDSYLLLLTQGEDTDASFDRACNIVSEYGAPQHATPGSTTFLAEHCECLIESNAVLSLGGQTE
jgi:adapter protein MecA 1/2